MLVGNIKKTGVVVVVIKKKEGDAPVEIVHWCSAPWCVLMAGVSERGVLVNYAPRSRVVVSGRDRRSRRLGLSPRRCRRCSAPQAAGYEGRLGHSSTRLDALPQAVADPDDAAVTVDRCGYRDVASALSPRPGSHVVEAGDRRGAQQNGADDGEQVDFARCVDAVADDRDGRDDAVVVVHVNRRGSHICARVGTVADDALGLQVSRRRAAVLEGHVGDSALERRVGSDAAGVVQQGRDAGVLVERGDAHIVRGVGRSGSLAEYRADGDEGPDG